ARRRELERSAALAPGGGPAVVHDQRAALIRLRKIMIDLPIWVFVTMILLIVILGTMLWTNLRERSFRVTAPDIDSFEEALPSIAGMTKAIIIPDNKVEVLQNGDELFPALLQSIAEAKETIHFETYVWWKGDICASLAEAFARR